MILLALLFCFTKESADDSNVGPKSLCCLITERYDNGGDDDDGGDDNDNDNDDDDDDHLGTLPTLSPLSPSTKSSSKGESSYMFNTCSMFKANSFI